MFKVFCYINILFLTLSFFILYRMLDTHLFFLASCFFVSTTLLSFLAVKYGILTTTNAMIYPNSVLLIILSWLSTESVFSLLFTKETKYMIELVPLLLSLLIFYMSYWMLRLLKIDEKNILSYLQFLNFTLKGPSVGIVFLIALPITACIVLIIHSINAPLATLISVKFTERGIIPPITLFIFVWGCLLFLDKYLLLNFEKYLMKRSARNSKLHQAYRASLTAYNCSAMDKIDYFCAILWKKSGEFYLLPKYLCWSIPILGFIGTVLGISLAADGIKNLMIQQQPDALSLQLSEAVSPLGIAFDTTLIALSLSVVLVLIQVSLQHFENHLLIEFESTLREDSP